MDSAISIVEGGGACWTARCIMVGSVTVCWVRQEYKEGLNESSFFVLFYIDII